MIGVGAVPNDELARDAGLAVDNGILVDEFGRTSDPAIFAAGDVTNHPNALFDRRLRLESVHNAMAQAKAVAQAIAGQPAPYADVPWFWSDQYDLKLQIAGVGDPDDELLLRGDPATRAFSCLHLRAGRLVAIDCVNRGADFLAAKKLIAEQRPLDRARAADPGIRLGELGSSSNRCRLEPRVAKARAKPGIGRKVQVLAHGPDHRRVIERNVDDIVVDDPPDLLEQDVAPVGQHFAPGRSDQFVNLRIGVACKVEPTTAGKRIVENPLGIEHC